MMPVEPSQLSQNHRAALSALSSGLWCSDFQPRSAKAAVNALWRFGMAERKIDPAGVFYRITDAGRAAMEDLGINGDNA